MKIYLKSALSFVLAFAIATVVSCGGSSKDESGELITPAADLTGEWRISENVTDCGGNYENSYTVDVSQSGNNLIITEHYTINGIISGNNVTWQASFFEDGETTTITFAGIVSSDGNTVIGKEKRTWTDGLNSCPSTAELTATRVSVPVVPETPALNLTDQWSFTEDGTDCNGSYTDTYTSDISQSVNNLVITIESIVINGTIFGNTITWHYFSSEGGETITSDFSGEVSANNNTITGQLSWFWTDGTDSCSGTATLTASRL